MTRGRRKDQWRSHHLSSCRRDGSCNTSFGKSVFCVGQRRERSSLWSRNQSTPATPLNMSDFICALESGGVPSRLGSNAEAAADGTGSGMNRGKCAASEMALRYSLSVPHVSCDLRPDFVPPSPTRSSNSPSGSVQTPEQECRDIPE